MEMSATADPLTDPELLATEWDLDPLVDGEGEAGVNRACSTRQSPPRPFSRSATPGKVAELDVAGLQQAMHELEEINELVGRAGSYASLRFSTDTADPARGALLQRVQERGTEIETKLLFFELEWAALDDERAEQLLAAGRRRADGAFCRHHLAQRPALPAPPAVRARGEAARREVDLQPRRLGPAVRRSRRGAAGQPRRRGADARRRAQPPAVADRDVRRTAAEAVSAALEPGLRTRGLHLQHAGLRQVGRGPAALLPALAREPQPRQRGLGRVRDGADPGRARSIRHPPALVPLKAKLIGVERLADYDRIGAGARRRT